MATIGTLRHHQITQHESAAGTHGRERTGRKARRPARSLEDEIEHTRVRTSILIGVGCTIVAAVLAVVLIGWQFAVVGTMGITLTAVLFGLPFWLASIDAEVDKVRARYDQDKH